MSEFDCGNRTDSCDNATICPCMNFINNETRHYSELLHSSLFREATKEERESVDNYIKSISKKLHTFTDEQLAEHDKQIMEDEREKVIDELLSKCNSFPNNNDCLECSFAKWKDNEWNGCIIEQLKENDD